MKKRRIYMGFALAAAVLLTACNSRPGRTLRVGVKDDVANFGLYDKDSGRYSGMEIDLAELLTEELGYADTEFTTVSATTREELIDSGDLDLVIATYSITENRKKSYDFSAPYYTDHVAIMVEKSSMIENLYDLRDCRVGVMKNSSNSLGLAEYMAKQAVIPRFDSEGFSASDFDDGISFVEYDSYEEISKALEYGDVEAFVADWSILSGYMRDDRDVLTDEFSQQEYGVCTKKGSALSGKVDEAIRKWKEDGTLKQLIDKWGN